MKKTLAIIFGFIGIIVVINLAAYGVKESMRQTKDQNNTILVPARVYQIELSLDSIHLYDGERYVGGIKTTWEHGIDSLIIKDNE